MMSGIKGVREGFIKGASVSEAAVLGRNVRVRGVSVPPWNIVT